MILSRLNTCAYAYVCTIGDSWADHASNDHQRKSKKGHHCRKARGLRDRIWTWRYALGNAGAPMLTHIMTNQSDNPVKRMD